MAHDFKSKHLNFKIKFHLKLAALKNFKGTVIFSTHDHEFAQTVANRIVEITPKGVIDRYMSFDEYLESDAIKELRNKMYA